MPSRPRIVGVDYGRKRVGLALADPLRLFAQPYGAFSPDEALRVLHGLYDEEGIETIIIGWPLTLAGEEGAATEAVAAFITRLQEVLPEVPVEKRDERHTSEMARDAIRTYGVRRSGHPKDDKGRVDAAAAALILQDYLDASTEGGEKDRQ